MRGYAEPENERGTTTLGACMAQEKDYFQFLFCECIHIKFGRIACNAEIAVVQGFALPRRQ